MGTVVVMGCVQGGAAYATKDDEYMNSYKGATESAVYKGEFLEDAVRAEWDEELSALFDLWDTDQSGALEMGEIGKIVAMYEGEPWATWDDARRVGYTRDFMKWYDTGKVGTNDDKLSHEELKKYITTQACVKDPTDPDEAMGEIVNKLTDIIKQARLDELFELWDADKSGFLEKDELNRVIALYNGEDWDVMTADEREAEGDRFIHKFDDPEHSDRKISKEEFRSFIITETVADDVNRPGVAFNNCYTKFMVILKPVAP